MVIAHVKNIYNCLALKARMINFNGAVTINGVGAKRKILAYKRRAPDIVLYEGFSNEDGSYSFQLNGNYHDDFRIIGVGNFGENSAIKERVSELGGE